MAHADFDPLVFARQQLHLAVAELDGQTMTPSTRIQLGLLAVQVALADRLTAPVTENNSTRTGPGEGAVQSGTGSTGIEWTAELAEQILRDSTSAGHRLVRALVDEGGGAGVEKLIALTGDQVLRAATQSLNMAAKRELKGLRRQLPGSRLVQAHHYENRATAKVIGYSLPPDSVPAFTEAIDRLDELHRRISDS